MVMKNILKIVPAVFLVWSSAVSCDSAPAPTSPEIRLSWDASTYQELTSMEIEGREQPENDLYYPRIRPLSDGSLMMSLMNHKFGWDVYVTKSWDGGATWEPLKIVRESRWDNSPEGRDVLAYVNPDFIQLSDGRIMLAWQWRYVDAYHNMTITNDNCGIEIAFSSDMGNTWSEPREIYRGRCWEPAMIQLPSGEIQLFLTDSGEILEDGRTKTCTAVIRSFDGGLTWQGKEVTRRADIEPISGTVCYGRRFDGMASAIRLQNGDIIVPMETWIRGHKADCTPVIARTTEKENWHCDGSRILENGGPDYPMKTGVNRGWEGYAPYCTITDDGYPIIGGHGYYDSNTSTYWVFIGDREGRNFAHPTNPFGGFWGNVCFEGGRSVIAASTRERKKDPGLKGAGDLSPRSDGYHSPKDNVLGSIYFCKALINRSKVISKGEPQLRGLHEFDVKDNDFWFLGKNGDGQLWSDFAYTGDSFILSSYYFDRNIAAFSARNSDASVLTLSRGKKGTYQIYANAAGTVQVYELEYGCWHVVYDAGDASVELDGTLNDPSDIDFGYMVSARVPWSVIGGPARKGEVIRAHMRRLIKDERETAHAAIEDQEGESLEFEQDWLSVKLN